MQKPDFNWTRYAGLGMQLVVVMLLFVWAGYELDKLFNFAKHWMTVVFSILGCIVSMVYVVVKFTKNKDQ